MLIKEAEITLYDENDDAIGFTLSPMQLQAIFKVLGIKPGTEPGTITCFSDGTIQKLFEMKGNPLKLEEVK